MPLTRKQLQLAETIDRWVLSIEKRGGAEGEILEGMYEYMATFKHVMDISTHEEMNLLFTTHAGFYRFAKLLEDLATGIQNGTIKVPNRSD
jgi:hypothetical protein